MKIYTCKEIPQRSEAWFNIKSLKLTASVADTIGANGTGLNTLCKKLVSEYVSDYRIENNYTNENIERGILLEPIIREKAKIIFNKNWQEIGFVEVNNRCGCSPDAVEIENNKIINILEIKAPNNENFMDLLLTNEIPKKYIYQMNFQMMCCKVKQAYFTSYNENIKPYYYTKIITPDAEIQEKLKKGLERGSELIDSMLLKYYEKVENE